MIYALRYFESSVLGSQLAMINPFKSQITDSSHNIFYSNIDAIYLFAFLPVALLLFALMFWLARFFIEKHKEEKLQVKFILFLFFLSENRKQK